MSGSLTIVSHPLVNAKLSVLRKTETTPKEFREVCIGAVCFTIFKKNIVLKWDQLRTGHPSNKHGPWY